jgi:hypothetical protein
MLALSSSAGSSAHAIVPSVNWMAPFVENRSAGVLQGSYIALEGNAPSLPNTAARAEPGGRLVTL